MAFQYVPSLFRIPPVPNFTPPDGMWRGTGADDGLFAFYATRWGGWTITDGDYFCYGLEVDGEPLRPMFNDVNGYVWWYGGWNVYYTRANGWICTKASPGIEPREDAELGGPDGRTWVWKGDEFWRIASMPKGLGEEVELVPRGRLRDSDRKMTMKAVWPRWSARGGEFGLYDGTDGKKGAKALGLPRFRGAGEDFVRSLAKTSGHYTYGRIRHAGGKWVIGEPGSANGWHEGAEPQVGGSVTFRFVRPEGSDVSGSDISVDFVSYVCGDETQAAYLGSVATWR